MKRIFRMNRKWLWYELTFFGILLVTVCFLPGCALSGSVIDRGSFETAVKGIHLVEYPALKVYHSGFIREIPLRKIHTVQLDASKAIVFDNELYYRADITLKDGSQIKSSEKSSDDRSSSFISVQNSIAGAHDKETCRISLDNIVKISIKR